MTKNRATVTGTRHATGLITLLRVHDLGTKYGPPTDEIDVEVVVWLATEEGNAFGFQLRNDDKSPSRQAMFDLLRDAFFNRWIVHIDYSGISPGRKNFIIRRVWVSRGEQ
jgi:hypothetical protein